MAVNERHTPVGLDALIRTCHRGWTVAVLAELERQGGGRVAELAHRLSAPRASIRSALAALEDQELIARMRRHAHPLSPEVALSAAGQNAAVHAAELMVRLRRLEAEARGLERRKWSLPVLLSVGSGASRFIDLSRSLAPATDRALAQALQRLGDGRLIRRSVAPTWPTRIRYAPTRRGAAVVEPLESFAGALAGTP